MGTASGMKNSAYLWSVRLVSGLGLAALTLTGEIERGFLIAAWSAWALSFLLDRFPEQQRQLRTYETLAVLGLVTTFMIDFFVRSASIFMAISHFLILF